MRILFFIDSLIGGGAERVTTILANEFVERGYKVKLFLKRRVIEYKLDDRIEIFHSPSFSKFQNQSIFSKLARYIQSYVKRFNDTRKVITDYKPDVIIASWGCNLLQVLLSAKKIPVIASEHNTFDRNHTCRERINRYYLNRFCKKVVVLTKFDQEFVSHSLKNTLVIPNPLTFDPISTASYNRSFKERHDILACGRLNAHHVKGFDNLLLCFSKISRDRNWKLDIAGKGDEQSLNYLKSLCRKYEIEDKVRFLGFCNDIEELMVQHSIFVLSSRTEGFGMVLTEAMSNGCPCVSYDLSGPREIIRHNVDGLLVESQNVESLGKAIEKLMKDETLRKEFGVKGLTNVTRFTRKVVVRQWISLFHSVIKNSS